MQLEEALLLPKQAAEKLKLTTATLQRMRTEGSGPAFVKCGKRRVLYRDSDLSAWLTGRIALSTTDARTRGLV